MLFKKIKRQSLPIAVHVLCDFRSNLLHFILLWQTFTNCHRIDRFLKGWCIPVALATNSSWGLFPFTLKQSQTAGKNGGLVVVCRYCRSSASNALVLRINNSVNVSIDFWTTITLSRCCCCCCCCLSSWPTTAIVQSRHNGCSQVDSCCMVECLRKGMNLYCLARN